MRKSVAIEADVSSTFGFSPAAWKERLELYQDAFRDGILAGNVKVLLVPLGESTYSDLVPEQTTTKSKSPDGLLHHEVKRDIDHLMRRYRKINWHSGALRPIVPFSMRFEGEDGPDRAADYETLAAIRSFYKTESYLVFDVLYHGWARESAASAEQYVVTSTVECKWVDLRSGRVVWYSRGRAEAPAPTVDLTTLPFAWNLADAERRVIYEAVTDALFGAFTSEELLGRKVKVGPPDDLR